MGIAMGDYGGQEGCARHPWHPSLRSKGIHPGHRPAAESEGFEIASDLVPEPQTGTRL